MDKLQRELYEDIVYFYQEIIEKNTQEILDKLPNHLEKYKNLDKNSLHMLLKDIDKLPTLKKYYDQFQTALFEKYGLNAKEINTASELDKNKTIIYRGVDIPKYIYLKKLQNKSYSQHREGAHGCGLYFAYDSYLASFYTKEKFGNILQASIDDDTKLINNKDLSKIKVDFFNELSKEKGSDENYNNIRNLIGDIWFTSVIAKKYGYDAIYVHSILKTDREVCMLNLDKVTFLFNEKEDIYFDFYKKVRKYFYKYCKKKTGFKGLLKFKKGMIFDYCRDGCYINVAGRLDENKQKLYHMEDIKSAKYLKRIVFGARSFYKIGKYGFGQYFTNREDIALEEGCEENLLIANLDETTQTLQFEEGWNLVDSFMNFIEEEKENIDRKVYDFCKDNAYEDASTLMTPLACAFGYDAIKFKDENGEGVVVLNPEKVTYLEK